MKIRKLKIENGINIWNTSNGLQPVWLFNIQKQHRVTIFADSLIEALRELGSYCAARAPQFLVMPSDVQKLKTYEKLSNPFLSDQEAYEEATTDLIWVGTGWLRPWDITQSVTTQNPILVQMARWASHFNEGIRT